MLAKTILFLSGLALGLAAGLMIPFQGGPPPGSSPRTAYLVRPISPHGKVVARVGGLQVTDQELRHRWRDVLDAPSRDFHRDRGGPRHYLDEIVEEKLLAQEAIARGYADRPQVRADLAMTLDVLVGRSLLEEEVTRRAFPEERLRRYYEEHPDEFTRPERVRIRQIAVTPEPFNPGQVARNSTGDDAKTPEEARKKIAFLQERLAAGEDFAELARKYSEDLTAHNGGDLGYVERGRMLPEFEKVVFSLEPGKVSEPVKTRVGLHLIQVEDHRAGELAPFEEARDRIAARLVREEPDKAKETYRAYVEELKKRYPVEIEVGDDYFQGLDPEGKGS